MDPNHDPNDASETIGLSLGLTSNSFNIKKEKPTTAAVVSSPAMKVDRVLPFLSLRPMDDHRILASPGSSSFSNNCKSNCMKTSMSNPEKEHGDDEEEGSSRKKLRLTTDQSSVLEDAFKEHATLNTNQKEGLAKQLNLRPRQVEVWFQNRRARTKLKKTERDCEILKKQCEKLREENKRLKKEVHELKSLKLHAYSGCFAPFHLPIL